MDINIPKIKVLRFTGIFAESSIPSVLFSRRCSCTDGSSISLPTNNIRKKTLICPSVMLICFSYKYEKHVRNINYRPYLLKYALNKRVCIIERKLQ